MKTFDELFNMVIKYEGYYSNITGDLGGETYMGIARNLHPNWKGWEIVDKYKNKVGAIKRNTRIPEEQLTELVKEFYKKKFYYKNRIDEIQNGSLQEIIFDWCVNSGSYGSKGVQKVLNNAFIYHLVVDGIIGSKTIEAINSCSANKLFDEIKKARIDYYIKISVKNSNRIFLKGWLRRVNSIHYSNL